MAQVVPINSRVGFQWKGAPIKLPESYLRAAKALGLKAGKPQAFEFRRCKEGTTVWLHFHGGLGLNLSVHTDTYPPNFKAARAWAVEYARIHGFKPFERRNVVREP